MRQYQDWIYVFLLIAIITLFAKVISQYEEIISMQRQNAVYQMKFDMLKAACQDFREQLETPNKKEEQSL
jgi:hypothetical protein